VGLKPATSKTSMTGHTLSTSAIGACTIYYYA